MTTIKVRDTPVPKSVVREKGSDEESEESEESEEEEETKEEEVEENKQGKLRIFLYCHTSYYM